VRGECTALHNFYTHPQATSFAPFLIDHVNAPIATWFRHSVGQPPLMELEVCLARFWASKSDN
jgi:hypothetical protein